MSNSCAFFAKHNTLLSPTISSPLTALPYLVFYLVSFHLVDAEINLFSVLIMAHDSSSHLDLESLLPPLAFITLALWAGMLGMKAGNKEHTHTYYEYPGSATSKICFSFLYKDQCPWTVKNGGSNVKTIVWKGQAVPSESRWITFVGWHQINCSCVCQVLDLLEFRWMEFSLVPLGFHPSFQDGNIPANPEQLQICARENC